jgi:cytochrome c2
MDVIDNLILKSPHPKKPSGRLDRRMSRRSSILVFGLLAILMLTGGVAVLRCGNGGTESSYFFPGDPKKGLKIFAEKNCIRCHAILGEGGRSAPDLARSPVSYASASQLVGEMWNHAPRMWEKMRLEHLPVPRVEPEEMTDLFAFLFSIRSFDDPGDSELGRKVVTDKGCIRCHSIQGRNIPSARGVGPDLQRWATYRNAVEWAQAMWNHSSEMKQAMTSRGIPWPQFQGNDMVNLIAYVRSQSSQPGGHVYLRLADPARGKALFQSKGCSQCHGSPGQAEIRPSIGPELGRRKMPRTVSQFAGLMWNHAPRMAEKMAARGVKPPSFSNTEMADLIAYLFSVRYFEQAGVASAGKQVFEAKGCASCHAFQPGVAGVGPDLSSWQGKISSSRLAAALWNHGPTMLERMHQVKIEWPTFRQDEMENLMAFLESQAQPQRRGPGRTAP